MSNGKQQVTQVVAPADEKIIAILRQQDARWTIIRLRSGETYRAFNIAWGYDVGDRWAHITTNISPQQESAAIDFFYTSDIARLVDEESGRTLFESMVAE